MVATGNHPYGYVGSLKSHDLKHQDPQSAIQGVHWPLQLSPFIHPLNPVGPDPRDPANNKRPDRTPGRSAREIYIPYQPLGSGIIPGQLTEGITIKPRDFR